MTREEEILERLERIDERLSTLFDKPVKKSLTKKDRKEQLKNQFKSNHIKQLGR